MDTFPQRQADSHVLTVYGDRLHYSTLSSIYLNMKTMSHKRSNTFTDLFTKSNMYASSIFVYIICACLVDSVLDPFPPKLI